MRQIDVIRGLRLILQVGPIAFAAGLRFAALTLQPQQTEDDDEQRADKPQPGGRPGVGAEETSGDNILDLRRAGQGVHGKRECPEGDGGRDQPFGDPALAKQFGGEGVDGKSHHKQRHPAVGQQGAHQHDHRDRVAASEDADGGGDNRPRESRQLNQLAEHGAQQKHREIELHKADHFFHKQAGKGRADRARVGDQHRAEGGDRRKEDHAVSTVGRQHQ